MTDAPVLVPRGNWKAIRKVGEFRASLTDFADESTRPSRIVSGYIVANVLKIGRRSLCEPDDHFPFDIIAL
jgi:hypothetical protein